MDIVLHGLEGKVDGVDYGAPMVPMASYSDQELADVLTYARNSFGNRAAPITTEQIAALRKEARPNFWTMGELETKYPVLKIPSERFVHRAEWKLTSSHAADTLPLAIDDLPETSYLATRNPFIGMWIVVELPKPGVVKTITMDAGNAEHAVENNYSVQLSDDGKTWSAPVAVARGENVTQIHIDHPARAKFVRLNLTEKNGWTAWAISDLEFYGDEDSNP